jgi:unsaturated rhamnogalacturonyl hydrolase
MVEDLAKLAHNVLSVLQENSKREGVDDHLTLDNWEWPTGVALFALQQIATTTKDTKLKQYVFSWFEEKLVTCKPHRNVNTVAPLFALACLYEHDPHPDWKLVMEDWISWILSEMPKTLHGGFQHATVLNSHYQQLWDDTLFMVVLFLAKAGRVFQRPELVEEAKYQFLIHIKYLQDSVTGLWYHGWTFDYRSHFGGVFWARGNSWFTAGSIEALMIFGREDAVSRMILCSLDEQVKELVKHQRQDGLFSTILDSEESYPETSATANIAYGLLKGIRLGLLDSQYKEVADKAVAAVLDQIGEDGTVHGVSHGTGMGMDRQFYRDIPIRTTAYGQGLVLLLISELLQQERM